MSKKCRWSFLASKREANCILIFELSYTSDSVYEACIGIYKILEYEFLCNRKMILFTISVWFDRQYSCRKFMYFLHFFLHSLSLSLSLSLFLSRFREQIGSNTSAVVAKILPFEKRCILAFSVFPFLPLITISLSSHEIYERKLPDAMP